MGEANKDDKVFYCENCGGVMEFDIETQKIKCPKCGTVHELTVDESVIREYDFNTENIEKASVDWNSLTHVLKCQSCGAELTVDKETTSVTCGYCGSSSVFESKQNAGIRPEAILTFKIDKNKANMIFSKWVKGRFFAPNNFRLIAEKDKLQAVYVPFWTFDAATGSFYAGMGGRVYTVEVGSGKDRHLETRVQWYPVNGQINMDFDDVLVDAASNRAGEVERIDNFNTKMMLPFEMIYLSGFIASKYSVEPQQAFEEAKKKMGQRITEAARNEILMRYDQANVTSVRTNYGNVKFKHVLLPVWRSGFMYQGKKYDVVINGANGKIYGKYPLSPVKVGILVILILIVIYIIYTFYAYDQYNYYGMMWENFHSIITVEAVDIII